MRRSATLAQLLLLSACVQLSGPDNSAPTYVSRNWLVGGWVPEGENCESDAGVRYDSDGTWVAYEAAGTWRLDSSSLFTVVTEKWTDGEDVPLKAPEHHVERIEVLGPDTYRSRWADGTVVTSRRCSNWN